MDIQPNRGSPGTDDWTGARGKKWLEHLSGLEQTLAPVNAPLIEALQLDRPCKIAETGCGGGATALALNERAPDGSVLHGFDISASLVEAARKRLQSPHAVFDVLDVSQETPDSVPYDRLVSRFGIMFFGDPASAFLRLASWLTSDSRFAFAVWGPPVDNPWATVVREAVETVVTLPSSAPDEPNLSRYADSSVLLELLQGAGFVKVQVEDWRGALPIGGGLPVAQAAEFALSSFGSYREELMRSSAAAFTRAREALIESFSDHLQGDEVALQARVHIVSGEGPACK
ncbi:MAG: methyltransferase domain-containing protein [Nannocystaceae bacterium]|nr:methyltransferase domain-containing protein [Nannocystaceae bacterium]